MYFWKIKQLREHLIQQGLGQHALFFYIFLFTVVTQLFMEFGFLFPVEKTPEGGDYWWAVFSTAAVGVGTWLCYYANGRGAGREFAERYFSIGFVVGLRTLALFIPVLICIVVIGVVITEETGPDSQRVNTVVDAAAMIWVIAYYWRVITHINAVARTRKP